jgi:hypothetical protein
VVSHCEGKEPALKGTGHHLHVLLTYQSVYSVNRRSESEDGFSLSRHRIVELNHHGSAVSELYGEPGMSGGAILGSAPISVIIDY